MGEKNQKLLIFLFIIIFFGILAFLDKNLAEGILFLSFLSLITFLIISKIRPNDRILPILFLVVIFIRLAAVLFIHYANFQPFSGGWGDYFLYHQQAQEIAKRVWQGNFSLKGLNIAHFYPVIIGYIYAITLPEMLIGQIFGVWLSLLSIVFLYFIILEITNSEIWGFLIGLTAPIYPSYLFYGSLLLKDTLVVPLVLGGLLIIIQLIKNFSWRKFIILYLILAGLVNLRFYIGYTLILTFIFCWPILSRLSLKKKLLYFFIIIPILGFLPQISGYGYYGIRHKSYLTPEEIAFYREKAYLPSSQTPLAGTTSSIVIELPFNHPLKFIINYLKSFIYVLLGPLPWQIKHKHQLFVLFEILPWYFLIFFIGKGVARAFRSQKLAISLIIFSFGLLAILSLFLSNFGIVTRIRIPAFLSLFCLIPLSVINHYNIKKNKKIRVCQITTVDSSIRFLLLNQIKNLQRAGYEVSAVCSPGKWIEEIEFQGIKVKTIKMKRKISPISDLIALFCLISFFKKEKFDIVHTHTPKASFLAQLAAKVTGVPIIINTLHGFYFQRDDPWLKRTLFIFIEKINASSSDLIFSVNKEDIETAIKGEICNRDLIKYLGHGIDLSRFNPKRFSQQFIENKKQELGIDASKKIIGIVARLVKEKGFLELFEAFRIVLQRFPKTLLLIIGPEEPAKRDVIKPEIVKNYGIEKNVIFLGERTDVEEIYPIMDIFVLPSYREGLGVAILEASAMERAVVASNIRGCREAVENGKTGILVPKKDPKKLAESIIYLLSNPEKAKEMGKEGRKKVEKEFDEELIFDRMEKEYRRLIEEKMK